MNSASAFEMEKIEAAVQVDNLFANYLVQLTPTEANIFVESADVDKKFVTLLNRINRVIPRSIRREKEYLKNHHHTYRVGRELGRRVIYLHLLKFHFPKGYRYVSLLKVLEKYSKAAGALHRVMADDNEYEILFWWI